MFSVHTTSKNFENAIITVYFGFVFEKKTTLGLGNHVTIVTSLFSKNSVLKTFFVHTKTQGLRFEERFRKPPFFKFAMN